MHEDEFVSRGEMNEREKADVDEILARFSSDGQLLAFNRVRDEYAMDGNQRVPIDYQVVRGNRFLVDKHGTVWRYFPEGSPKAPNQPGVGGPPWRFNAVEMWKAMWRKVKTKVDGEDVFRYAKSLAIVPIDKRINGQPNMAQIDWYLYQKGYKHPFSPPHAPTDMQMRVLERNRAVVTPAVFAKLEKELEADGIEAAEDILKAEKAKANQPVTPPKAAKPKRRTNRRKAASAAG